eukprot:gene65547-biopygen48023
MSLAAMTLSLALPLPGHAADFQDQIANIEKLDSTDDKIGAYEAMRAMLLDYYQAQPFQIMRSTFTEAAPTGFGVYDPHETNTFKVGDTIHFYAEPLGMSWVQQPDGQYQAT